MKKIILIALAFSAFITGSYAEVKEYPSFCPPSVSLTIPSAPGKSTRWNPRVGPDYAAATVVPNSFPLAKIFVSNLYPYYTDLVCVYTNSQVTYVVRIGCNDTKICNCSVSPSNSNTIVCKDSK